MDSFFYNFGRGLRSRVQNGKWVWQSLTGNEEEAIQAERDAGREMALAFEKQAPIERDPAIVALIDATGADLVARVSNKLRRFTFRCVTVPEINAFALPGGFIYVTRAMIEMCSGIQDSSLRPDLAFILGHEMGHVIRGHAWMRMTNDAVVNVATRAVPVGGVIGKLLVNGGSRFLRGAYSQDQELEADELGLRLTRAAGYEAQASVRMMQRLKQLGGDNVEGSLGAFFATHPPFDVRIRHLRRLMA